MQNNRIATIVECALGIALSAVLNLLALRLPVNFAGGSISLTMLPVAVVALRRGPVAGAVCGAAFGLLDLLMEPYIVFWAQVILDYPLPYLLFGAGVGAFAPLYRKLADKGAGATARSSAVIVASMAVGGVLRWCTHVLSGVIFFSENAVDQNVWIYSMLYNASYVLPSLIASCILALVLVPILARAVPVRRAAAAARS
jgi:thiamine transporter